jgi:hypothetical protein
MYAYMVTDVDFEADRGFSVYFIPGLYSDLQDPPPAASADWDILTQQPDLALPADGIYDALALVNGASLGQPFALTFRWLGAPGTAPGSQAFTINQFDPVGNISFIESGQTAQRGDVSSVPEPSTILLVGSSIALARRRLRASRLTSRT